MNERKKDGKIFFTHDTSIFEENPTVQKRISSSGLSGHEANREGKSMTAELQRQP